MASATPMPDGVRQKITAGATLLALTAALGNFGHVFEAAIYAGQIKVMAGVIAGMPDLLLVLCLFKLRYHRDSRVGQLGLAVAVGFIGWGSIVGSEPDLDPADASTLTRWVVGAAPLVFAVVAAGLLESRPEPVVAVEKQRPRKKPQRQAERLDPSNPAGEENAGRDPGPAAAPRFKVVPGSGGDADGSPQMVSRYGADLLEVAKLVASELAAQQPPKRLSRDGLVAGIRAKGHTCNNATASELLRQLKTGAA
jgi:hypothetical protein